MSLRLAGMSIADFFGAYEPSEGTARAFARFDRKLRGVQPAEFYRRVDGEIARDGYI